MIKFDTWLITNMEDAYLWIYDRSGVYLGTVGMIAMVISAMVDLVSYTDQGFLKGLTIFNVALIGFNMFQINSRQSKEEYLLHNLIADFFRSSKVRCGFFFVFYTFVVLHTIRLDGLKVVSDLAFIVVMVSVTIRLREREPKDWFKAKEPNIELAESRIGS